MTDRDCANCKHHTEDGCSSWDCEYEPKDLISRADAKKEMYLLGKNPSINEIWDCLDALPSADRQSGEWQRKEKEYNDCDGHRAYYWYECSECGAKPPKDQWKNEWLSPYCPSCGAYMGERKEE